MSSKDCLGFCICLQNYQNFIVSYGGEETSCVCRRLLSKSEYPFLGRTSTFYRRGNRLVARETEREGVCATLRCLKTKLASVVNSRLGKGCHENLHIKVVCLRNYLNCEKGIKERE